MIVVRAIFRWRGPWTVGATWSPKYRSLTVYLLPIFGVCLHFGPPRPNRPEPQGCVDCGEEPVVIQHEDDGIKFVECQSCGRRGPEEFTMEHAGMAWNDDMDALRIAKEEPWRG